MHALSAIALVAEEKIRQAQAEGAFDNLQGAGQPLELEDLSHIPPDMRMAYTILKNSGFLAPTVKGSNHAPQGAVLPHTQEEALTHKKLTRLKLFLLRIKKARGASPCLFEPHLDGPYFDALLNKV